MGEMDTVIYMTDGTIRIEKVKINKQFWVNPLIEINATVSGSGATIEFLSSNITNCVYYYSGSSWGQSAIIYFFDISSQKLNMTFLSSSFLNNYFHLLTGTYSYGSTCKFGGENSTSGIIYFFF
jgi:hypothetical protein